MAMSKHDDSTVNLETEEAATVLAQEVEIIAEGLYSGLEEDGRRSCQTVENHLSISSGLRLNASKSESMDTDTSDVYTHMADNEVTGVRGGEKDMDESFEFPGIFFEQNLGDQLYPGASARQKIIAENFRFGPMPFYKRGSGALVQTSSDTACDKGGREQFDNSVGACEMGQ